MSEAASPPMGPKGRRDSSALASRREWSWRMCFFAEAEPYTTLATRVLPELAWTADLGRPLRVWVAGCGGGVEAFGLAILFDELFERTGRRQPLRIFATDLDPEAVRYARAGRYEESSLASVSEAKRAKFFYEDSGAFHVNKSIREHCVFSVHDLVRDPPISSLDLIFCPYVLGELREDLQAKLLPVFHYALKRRGCLVLGSLKRPPSLATELFQPLDTPARVLRRRDGKRPRTDYSMRGTARPSSETRLPCDPLLSESQLLECSREELAAVIEELQTTREELSTINAEVQGLNMELERKLVALDDANAYLYGLFSALPVAAVLLDCQLSVTHFTRAASEVFGLIDADIGRPIIQLNPRLMGMRFHEELERVITTSGSFEQQARSRDGRRFFIVRGVPYRGRKGELHGVVVTAVDVTALKQAEQERLENEQRLRLANEAASISTFDLAFDDGALSWSSDAHQLFGGAQAKTVTELLGLVHPEDAPGVAEAIRGAMRNGGPGTVRRQFRAAGEGRGEHWGLLVGQTVFEGHGMLRRPLLLRGIIMNITQQKQAEGALLRAARMEALGVIAGGIAHDFNNLLLGIFGHVSLAREVAEDAQVCSDLDAALAAHARASSLSHQLLTFAKGGAPRRVPGCVAEVLESAVKFALHGSKLVARFEIQERLWLCSFDPHQLARVFENLAINAREAVQDAGDLEVTAGNRQLAANQVARLPAGDYVCIALRDRGPGIAAQDMARIFDPFFTTKQRGSGLGLATAYSIVRQHEGLLEVESEPGKGSCFHVYLPRCGESLPERPTRECTAERGFGRVLVMDDQDIARSSVGGMLRSLGCEVSLASDGKEALEVFTRENAEGRPFSAVFLDLTVPGGIGGAEVAQALRTIAPQTPLIAMSGYAEDSVIAQPKEHGFTDSIGKPMLGPDLLAVLQRTCKPRSS